MMEKELNDGTKSDFCGRKRTKRDEECLILNLIGDKCEKG